MRVEGRGVKVMRRRKIQDEWMLEMRNEREMKEEEGDDGDKMKRR